MRLVTWNVNAFKSLYDLTGEVICIQEVKGKSVSVDGYLLHESKASVRGYSGVATLTRKEWAPFAVSDTLMVNGKKDDQGRFLLTDHRQFVLINAYFPYCSDESKLEYKSAFHYAVSKVVQCLIHQNRSVIIVGDFNCTYDSKDSFYSQSLNSTWADWFINLMNEYSLVDAYKSIHPESTSSYTCWNVKLNCRAVNQGSRIDYILVSSKLLDFLKSSDHLTQVEGSDHCPVIADFEIDPIIHQDQKVQNLQSSIKDFFEKSQSDSVAPVLRYSTVKKQKKLSEFFQQPSKESKGPATEIIQLNKKIKTVIDEWNQTNPKEGKNDTVNQWDILFTPKPPPKCYHNEPCKEFKTKVKGPNIGR